LNETVSEVQISSDTVQEVPETELNDDETVVKETTVPIDQMGQNSQNL